MDQCRTALFLILIKRLFMEKRKVSNRFKRILFIIPVVILFSVPSQAEFIFLSDGSIVEGTITSDAATYITIRTPEGKGRQILRKNILRILYTKLAMGKVYVQKRDGKGIEAYMVDEDQDSYTFRVDLYKPVEFKLKRTEVLFMAEKNPSGLEGEAYTDRIEFKWLPPYNKIKTYTIYMKTSEKDKYEPVASTENLDCVVKKLKSNTTYWVIVTATDTDDYESLPSNELKITTKNILPGKPGKVIYTIDDKGNRVLTWKAAVDPDGKIEKYRVYSLQGDEQKTVGETESLTYKLKADVPFDKIYLAAVDNMGDESGTVRAFEYQGREMHVTLYPGAVLPLGEFGEITGPGFGLTASFTLNNYFYKGLVLGAEVGFYSLLGKDALETEYKKTNTVFMAPLLLTAGYCFDLNYYFSVTPYAGLGLLFFYTDYVSRDRVLLYDSSKSFSEVGPALCAGVAGSYRLTESISIVLRLNLGYLAVTESGLYTGCDIGCMYRL